LDDDRTFTCSFAATAITKLFVSKVFGRNTFELEVWSDAEISYGLSLLLTVEVFPVPVVASVVGLWNTILNKLVPSSSHPLLDGTDNDDYDADYDADYK
jgi:hypothetical protein